MLGIGEHTTQLPRNPVTLSGILKPVMEPVERLDDPHCGSASPVQPARCGGFEPNLLVPQADWAKSGIDECLDPGRNRRRQPKVVGGCHTVDENARLVPARNRLDDCPVVGDGLAAREAIAAWAVVEPTVDASELTCRDEALERLIDRGACREVDEVAGRPYPSRMGVDPVQGSAPQVG
jgi:hypothetical protein